MCNSDKTVYAKETIPTIKVSAVRPLADHKLWVRFVSGEFGICDFKSLLDQPAFRPLRDKHIFSSVTIDHGVPVWCNGSIDIAPEYLYERFEKGKAMP